MADVSQEKAGLDPYGLPCGVWSSGPLQLAAVDLAIGATNTFAWFLS